MTRVLHRPVTKEALTIEEVEVKGIETDNIGIVEGQPRPAGVKALKEDETRKLMDEHKSDFFKMTETVERAKGLWEN